MAEMQVLQDAYRDLCPLDIYTLWVYRRYYSMEGIDRVESVQWLTGLEDSSIWPLITLVTNGEVIARTSAL